MTTLDDALAAQMEPPARPCIVARLLERIPPDDVPRVLALIDGRTLTRAGVPYGGETLSGILRAAYGGDIPSEHALRRHRAGTCRWCNRSRGVAA